MRTLHQLLDFKDGDIPLRIIAGRERCQPDSCHRRRATTFRLAEAVFVFAEGFLFARAFFVALFFCHSAWTLVMIIAAIAYASSESGTAYVGFAIFTNAFSYAFR
jgi:hypothetical protein